MKIIYLHQYFNTPSMRGGTRSFDMALKLVAKGHEVHMITTVRDKGWSLRWRKTLESGIQVYWLPVPYNNKMGFLKRTIAFFTFAILSTLKAKSIKSDLVFGTSTPLTISIPAVIVSKIQRVPMIFEVRDLWPELPIAMGALKNPIVRFLAKCLEKWAYLNSSAVIALSPGMKRGVVKAGYPKDKIAVIPNISNIELFNTTDLDTQAFRDKRPWLASRPIIVYAGAFGPINGVGYMVEVAKVLNKLAPDICIYLIGQGKEYTVIKETAKREGLLNLNVFIEPSLAKNDVPKVLEVADIVVGLFIDKQEMQANSSNKFFDALASGKPIMINYGGWQKDLIEINGAGLATQGMSYEQVAQCLIRCLGDPEWLNAAGKSAKNLAVNSFSREILTAQFEEVFVLTLNNEVSRVSDVTPQY